MNGALSSCDVTAAATAVAAETEDDDDREDEDEGDINEEDEDGEDKWREEEEEEEEDADREAETGDSRGSADIASVKAAAATMTTIRIDHDQLYRLRVFHILPTNAQVSGGVVTHATGGQQQLIGRPMIASAAVIAS